MSSTSRRSLLPIPASRFLSRAECATLATHVHNFATGGGHTAIQIESTWTGNTRWARNQISTSGDVRNQQVTIIRDIRGAGARVEINQVSDAALQAGVRRAERLLPLVEENRESELQHTYPEAYLKPDVWSDATYTLAAGRRAEVMRHLVTPAERAGMLTAGYIEVSAHGRAVMDDSGQSMYYPFTQAQYSVTVRDPQGTGSGWAGVDWYDWTKIDTAKLSAIALDKCLKSRNPVAVEPGRYTTILEPQAVCDLWSLLIAHGLYRPENEQVPGPFFKSKGFSRLGETVIDPRITISADPMDPELAFPPFSISGAVYRPVTWITRGVLTDLWYTQDYAVRELGVDHSLCNSGAFRMSGGTTSIDEMIATTTRGLLVTRFSDIAVVDAPSWLLTGYTRDGLWLIEHGKISKAVKNFRFTESPLFAFNNVEQLGVPQRVFHPEAPVVVPPAKVRDFSFTSLSDAV